MTLYEQLLPRSTIAARELADSRQVVGDEQVDAIASFNSCFKRRTELDDEDHIRLSDSEPMSRPSPGA